MLPGEMPVALEGRGRHHPAALFILGASFKGAAVIRGPLPVRAQEEPMTDDELVAGFEAATLPSDRFTHTAHVRVAWWYLKHHPLGEALTMFTASLKHFAARHGATGLYHETITVAYVLLIAERLALSSNLSWDAFSAAYPELLARQPSLLERYYDDATLQSRRAKAGFVMPVRVTER
jgi:hypothetical protein